MPWSCGACTFENGDERAKCEVCDTAAGYAERTAALRRAAEAAWEAEFGRKLVELFRFPDLRGCNSGETRVSCVLEPWLWLGGSDVAKDVAWHRDAGTRAVFNVGATDVRLPVADLRALGVEVREYAIDDSSGGAAALQSHLSEVADAIHAHGAAGRRVLVHCAAGKSRSASFVIAYLMRHHDMSLRDAWQSQKALCSNPALRY